MVTKVVEFEKLRVLPDGQIQIIEVTHYKEGGVIMSSRRDDRMIDVGDDVSAEDELIRDVVNGNLHSQGRRDARAAAEAAAAARANRPTIFSP